VLRLSLKVLEKRAQLLWWGYIFRWKNVSVEVALAVRVAPTSRLLRKIFFVSFNFTLKDMVCSKFAVEKEQSRCNYRQFSNVFMLLLVAAYR